MNLKLCKQLLARQRKIQRRLDKANGVRAAPFLRYLAREHPVTTVHTGEVFRLHPYRGLLVVTRWPEPEPVKNTSVYLGKGAALLDACR